MKTPKTIPLAKAAILTLAEIKAAVESFDRGEANVLVALDAVIEAVEAYREAAGGNRKAA